MLREVKSYFSNWCCELLFMKLSFKKFVSWKTIYDTKLNEMELTDILNWQRRVLVRMHEVTYNTSSKFCMLSQTFWNVLLQNSHLRILSVHLFLRITPVCGHSESTQVAMYFWQYRFYYPHQVVLLPGFQNKIKFWSFIVGFCKFPLWLTEDIKIPWMLQYFKPKQRV